MKQNLLYLDTQKGLRREKCTKRTPQRTTPVIVYLIFPFSVSQFLRLYMLLFYSSFLCIQNLSIFSYFPFVQQSASIATPHNPPFSKSSPLRSSLFFLFNSFHSFRFFSLWGIAFSPRLHSQLLHHISAQSRRR